MKKFTAIFTLAVILLGSCRKEIQTNQVDVSKLAITTAVSATPSISDAAITNWFVKNPIGTHLSVDWKKARQTTINGVAIVTVPVKNITLNAGQQTGAKQASDLSSSTTATLTTFDPYHPPALYFFQDKNSAHPDSIHSILMNFVPDDPTKEDGANKIWTGKLAEWNMQGDSLLYQHLTKSKVDGKYRQQLGQPAAVTTGVNSVGAKKTAAIKTNSIFGDIWDAVTSFFEYWGYQLGLPGNYYNPGYGIDDTITWCDFLGGMFCGGGGGGGGGSDGTGNSYSVIYSSYMSGYNGYDAAQGSNWSVYISTTGGGSGGGEDTPCIPSAVKGKTIQQLAPGCSGSTIYVSSAMVVNSVCVNYNLTTDQQQWLNLNLGYFDALTDYINSNPYIEGWYDAADFLNFSIEYLMENATTPNDFISQFPVPIPIFDIDAPYTDEPANDYQLDAATTAAYPRFTKLVNQLPQYLAANPKVLAAIMYYTDYTKAQVMQMVAPGQGPQIVVKPLSGVFGHYPRYDNYGDPVNPKPNVVEINQAFVNGLENANLEQTQQGTAFLLAVTIFHETVHLARNMHNLPDDNTTYEWGEGFENLAFKVVVTRDNANSLTNYDFILD